MEYPLAGTEISGESAIDSVCLVQTYRRQQQYPDEEAGRSRSSRAAVEKLALHPMIAPSEAAREEPKDAGVSRAATEAEVNASQGAAFLAVADRILLNTASEVHADTSRVLGSIASEVQVDASQQSSERRRTTGTVVAAGSAAAVFAACSGLACLMLCCSGGPEENGVAKHNTPARSAANKVISKVGTEKSLQSMWSMLSQRSLSRLPSQQASASTISDVWSAGGDTAGPLPGKGAWYRKRSLISHENSARTSSIGDENSQGPAMGKQRSSISVAFQGDRSQWAPDGWTTRSSSTTLTSGLRTWSAGPSERRFAVSMNSLAGAERTGVFQVRSEKGYSDMLVAIDKDAARGPRLSVSASGGGGGGAAVRPMMTVGLSSEHVDARGAPQLEVKDSEGGSYGLLGQTSEGYVLALRGAPLLVVNGADDASLHMSVRTGNGQQVATVGCGFAAAGFESQEELVELVVGPGADPSLVVASVLSVLLLFTEDCEDED